MFRSSLFRAIVIICPTSHARERPLRPLLCCRDIELEPVQLGLIVTSLIYYLVVPLEPFQYTSTSAVARCRGIPSTGSSRCRRRSWSNLCSRSCACCTTKLFAAEAVILPYPPRVSVTPQSGALSCTSRVGGPVL